MEDLTHGNVNILIFFLVVAGLWAFTQAHDARAGLAVALATAFKVTPALLIPYFAYKRQWRVLAGSLIGLVLFLLVLPAFVLGPVRNVELLTAWAELMIAPYAIFGAVKHTIQINQSLPGVFLRLFTESPGIEIGGNTTIAVNWMALDPAVARWVLKGLLLAIVGWLAWICRTPAADRGDWRLTCEYGLVLIAMLFVSERTWKGHYVTMALPFSCVVAHLALRVRAPAMRRYLTATLVAAFLLMASTSPDLTDWIANGMGHKYAEAYGMFFLSALVIFAALSAILRRSQHPCPGSSLAD